MVDNIFDEVSNLDILNIKKAKIDKKDNSFECAVLDIVKKEPIEEDNEATFSTMSLALNTYRIKELTLEYDYLITDQNEIAQILFHKINALLLKTAKKAEIFNLDSSISGKDIYLKTLHVNKVIETDTGIARGTFAIVSLDTHNKIVSDLNKNKLFKNGSSTATSLIINSLDGANENYILVGANPPLDKGGVVLCFDPDRFLTHEVDKTILRFGLDIVGKQNFYRLIELK